MAKSAARRPARPYSIESYGAPVPKQVPQKQALAKLKKTSLWYSDTGGKGQAIIFMHHAATGNPAIWCHQQPFFAKLGYRVISYSRRGYYKSGKVSPRNPGNATEDLLALVDYLGLKKFHLVSTAAGGSIAADFGLSYPKRLYSLAVTSNYAGVRKGYIFKAAKSIRPAAWNDLPRWFREFGCSYIMANQAGVKRFKALQDEATKRKGVEQELNFMTSEKTLEKMKVPTFLLTGDADLSSPPALMRMVADHIPRSTLVVVPEAGHTPFWEFPALFNKELLAFIRKNSR